MSHNTNIVGVIYIRTSIWKEIEGLQGLRFQSGHAWLVLLLPWMKRNGWIAILLIYWVYGTFIRNPVIWSLDIKFSPVDSNLFSITSSKLEIGYQCGQMLHNSSPNHKLNHGTFAGINIFNIQYIHELLQSVSRYRNIAIQHFTNRCPDVSTKFAGFCPNCNHQHSPRFWSKPMS